ncbi:pentapeptide repeat-containing protein, partial [Burkholderia sp. Bp8986]
MLDYKGQEFFISESKHGAVVSDYVHECPGWFSGLVLPPSKSPDGIRLTAALRGKAGVTSSEASELKGKDLQQLMRSGADFSQAVFEKMDFSHMNLHGLDLRGAQFIGCTMDCTDFSKARLQGARFVDCQMVSCKFKGAKAGQDKKGKVRTEFQDCRMKWCDFTDHADFSGARFVRCVGNSCYLMGTNLQGAEFTDCYLLNMDLRNAMLKEATFVSLNRATPDGMPVPYDGRTNRQAPEWLPPNFLYSDVTHTRFLNCQLSGFFFAGARI